MALGFTWLTRGDHWSVSCCACSEMCSRPKLQVSFCFWPWTDRFMFYMTPHYILSVYWCFSFSFSFTPNTAVDSNADWPFYGELTVKNTYNKMCFYLFNFFWLLYSVVKQGAPFVYSKMFFLKLGNKRNQPHLLSVFIKSAAINAEQPTPQMILSVLIAVPTINRQTYI